jgi:hypothetical protein
VGIVDPVLRRELSRLMSYSDAELIAGHVETTYRRGELDGRPAWVSDQGHGNENDHVILRLGSDEWAVVADNPEATGRFAVRVGRELLRMQAAIRGGVTVHASCATLAGRTMLFLGSSGNGKTTLSLAVSRHGGFLVSGDQTELLPHALGPVAVGFPWVPRLGFGTLDGLGLAKVVERSSLLRPQPSIVDNRVVDEARHFGSPVKIELSLTEVEMLLGGFTTDAAALDAVVVLDRADEVLVGPADLASVLPLVTAELREPDPAFPDWWLDSANEVTGGPQSLDDLVDLIAGLPLLRAYWDPSRHLVADVIDSLIRATTAIPQS